LEKQQFHLLQDKNYKNEKNYHQVGNKYKECIESHFREKKVKMKKKYFWVMKDFIKLVLWFSN
jgi:hypothetical protein